MPNMAGFGSFLIVSAVIIAAVFGGIGFLIAWAVL